MIATIRNAQAAHNLDNGLNGGPNEGIVTLFLQFNADPNMKYPLSATGALRFGR